MVTELRQALESFQPISLKELEGSLLMNRIDTKYYFNTSLLSTILPKLTSEYSVLTIDHHRLFTYETLYYDTLDLLFYRQHHNGVMNRRKIRHRTYVESNLGFLELKEKDNKGRTNKERIKIKEAPQAWDEASEIFLQKRIPLTLNTVHPNILVCYKRITFVNKFRPERVTIDTDVHFLNNEVKIALPGLIIAEVKQEKRMQSGFIHQMREARVKMDSISKYCLGIALTMPSVKSNNFKPSILQIKKILN
jgi:hypothetical protein